MAVYTILKDTAIYNDNSIVMAGTDFAQGMAIGMLLVGLIMSSRYGVKIRAFKQRLLKKNVIHIFQNEIPDLYQDIFLYPPCS